MNRRLILMASLALVAGCASPAPRILTPSGAPLSELEPLYGAAAGRTALTITVASNGCTRKEDFAFFVDQKGSGPTLACGRKRLDTCQSFAMGKVELTFSYGELGLADRTAIFLLNPLYPWTGPGL